MCKGSKIIAVILTAIVLITSVTGTARAAEQITGNNAVVISTSLSIRSQTDTDSTKLAGLKNGNTMLVVAQVGDWYQIDLASIGLEPGYGYARKQFIALNPRFVVTTLPETMLWADPWGSGLSVGSKERGTEMLVLNENAEYYLVQCRESTAGSAFIRKSDIHGGAVSGTPDTNGNVVFQPGNGAGRYLVNCQTLGVYPKPDDNVNRIDFLHRGDIVTVLELGEYFTKIAHNMNDVPCEAWVHTQYLLKTVE